MTVYYNSNKNEIINFQNLTVSPEILSLVPSSVARQYNLFPFKLEGENLFIAMEDVNNFLAIEHIKRITNQNIIPTLAPRDLIDYYINFMYGNEPMERALVDFHREIRVSESQGQWLNHSSDVITSAPIVRLLDSLIEQAIEQEASDIHIEPLEGAVRIRYRIDGLLRRVAILPIEVHDPLMTRVKIFGNMNIAEKRLPQDGRSEFKAGNTNIDIRIAIIPTIYGEKCVLRLLHSNYFLFSKDALGFSDSNLKHFDHFLTLSRGIVLLTGPTGSGKSSTLYTMLGEINKETDNIITVEDPVECKIPGINQIQINTKAGMTFANSLRSVLRQDPDIIMIGEIRDIETAKIAIRAAITGHLVLSTIHTHNAVGAVGRLLDMGIENYLLSDALMGIISQRLIRKVCPYCRREYVPSSEDIKAFGLSMDKSPRVYESTGCTKCNFSGYLGRIAVHEILPIDKKIRKLIQKGSSSEEILKHAKEQGFVSLDSSCIDLFEKGVTSLDEVSRALHSLE